jgi:chemotaxis signal transduction protein
MFGLGLPIDGQIQTAKSKEGEYLAFTFFEKNHGMELEVAGWTKLRPLPGKPDYIMGDVNPWGFEIPVIDLKILYGKGPTEMTAKTCFVILEHPESREYYFGMVVEELSNIINIADGTENKMSPLLLSAKRHLSTNPTVKN